ncbi:cysteine proteinase [Scleroderma citrinum]
MRFLQVALEKAKRTLTSPPPPLPFSAHDILREAARKKDEAIEHRIRPPKALPHEVESEVNTILGKRGVISKIAREQVCDKDVARLRPAQWLNDEIINFYGAMILARSEACRQKPQPNGVEHQKLLDVHYFSTFFWSKLVGEGYERARLAKWTKKFDIFAKDIILIPINHNNAHWTGAAINFRRKRIESYDSMNIDRRVVFERLRHYLDVEHRNKRGEPFDFEDWVNYDPDVRVTLKLEKHGLLLSQDTPQQENGYDCGVFTCQFLESLSRGEESFNFTQRDMNYFRRRMIWEIAHTKFFNAS